MKKILTTILIITIASVIFAGIVFAEPGKGTVNASELNLRETASTSANAVDVLYRGAKVTIISEEGDWYKVKYNNEEGYVSKQYVTRDSSENNTTSSQNTSNNNTVENTTGSNTTTSTNPIDINELNKTNIKEEATMYVLPLINSTKLGTISEGTKALLISVNGDWAYIQTDNSNAWVLTKTLAKTSITLPNNNANANTPNQANNTNTLSEENNATNENNTTSGNTVDNTILNETTSTTTEPTSTPTPEPTSTSNEYPITMYVNVEAVNVRREANTTSEIVTSVGKNVPVTVTSKEGEWYKVQTSDGNGYIKGDYLSKTK